MDAIAIFISGIFPLTVAYRLMLITPWLQAALFSTA
jgi:hypothetical protein